MINAVVPPHTLDGVRRILERYAVLGMTVAEVGGRGRDRRPVEIHRGTSVQVGLVPTLRLEVVVHDELVERILTAVERDVGSAGGKLWVTPLDLVLRVRTGERGADAV